MDQAWYCINMNKDSTPTISPRVRAIITSILVGTPVQTELLAAIDHSRMTLPFPPTRPKAFRRLVGLGITKGALQTRQVTRRSHG
jgi:hypothetical protein